MTLKPICLAVLLCGPVVPAGSGVIASRYIDADFAPTADPAAPQWKDVNGIFMENGPKGDAVPGHRTEVRSRWTKNNVYFLFICPYETLHLKPAPSVKRETYSLWDWDVAEVFVGSDFEHINRYKEFEISPRGEWVDLDIDRNAMNGEKAWLWNSKFQSKARIDANKRIWYGEMRIPLASIDTRAPAAGNEMRINFYRCQGPPPNRKFIAWQPTQDNSFHVPEAFGRMKLEK